MSFLIGKDPFFTMKSAMRDAAGSLLAPLGLIARYIAARRICWEVDSVSSLKNSSLLSSSIVLTVFSSESLSSNCITSAVSRV